MSQLLPELAHKESQRRLRMSTIRQAALVFITDYDFVHQDPIVWFVDFLQTIDGRRIRRIGREADARYGTRQNESYKLKKGIL